MTLVGNDDTTSEELSISAAHTVTRFSSDQSIDVIGTLSGTPLVGMMAVQALGDDDIPQSLDIGIDPTLQQYRKIHNAVIYIQGDLSYEGNIQDNTLTVTGEVLIGPEFTVNTGDIFYTKLSDGTPVLYTFSAVTPVGYNTKTAYRAVLLLFSMGVEDYLDNITYKTVETLYFDNDTRSLSSYPYANQSLQIDVDKIMDYYFTVFYDPEHRTLRVPSDEAGTLLYDPFLTLFVRDIIPEHVRRHHGSLMVYNCANKTEDIYSNRMIWGSLIRREKYMFNRLYKQVVNISPGFFKMTRINASVNYSKFTDVVWPAGHHPYTDEIDYDSSADHYVMSEAFYSSREEDFTVFDSLVWDYLHNTLVDRNRISEAINDLFENGNANEQIYQLPVLMMLLEAITYA